MAAATSHAALSVPRREQATQTYDVVHEGRLVARLVTLEPAGPQTRVTAEIHPVHAPLGSDPQRRVYDFPTRATAQRFVDETLLALEYLGCVVREAGDPGRDASRDAA
ncbi:MAG TPA: hypothetical protein VFB26_12335 [Gaiellaceae bacterium]|nr:hypothetical protein [Gaiellaceae bacterium]